MPGPLGPLFDIAQILGPEVERLLAEEAPRDRLFRAVYAIHAPRGMLEFYADPTSAYHMPEFDPDKRVILHCASGGRSALAAVALRELGYARVAHLAPGLKGWVEAGLAVDAYTPDSF
jgi:rhodanese-related sulfurtransferase